MSKNKTAQKWAKKDKEPELPMYRTGGNLIRGYTVLTRSNDELARYENVRDAVAHTQRLLNGEEPPERENGN